MIMIIGIDKRWYMRTWLHIDAPTTYTFKQYLKETMEQTIDSIKMEYKEHGVELNDEFEFEFI